MVVVTPTKIYCKKIEKSCITVTVLVGIDDLFGDCYSHSGLYVCIFGLCLAPQKILFPMIKSMDVRNTWKYPMFKQTHIMQGRVICPIIPHHLSLYPQYDWSYTTMSISWYYTFIRQSHIMEGSPTESH